MSSLYLIYSVVKYLGHLHVGDFDYAGTFSNTQISAYVGGFVPDDGAPAAQCYLCTCQGACAQDPGLRGPECTVVTRLVNTLNVQMVHSSLRPSQHT